VAVSVLNSKGLGGKAKCPNVTDVPLSRAMEKHWKQREKEIERVVKNTAGLYGDMQGIIGGQIPTIPALELDGETTKQLLDASNTEPLSDSD